ncbi:MAG: crossover junction endodeoxyribonuclease RuvC [Hydrotalea sp.]|nr:crossover junction endodeoxyribonuclease RuvC [Hydrotalea sp.]
MVKHNDIILGVDPGLAHAGYGVVGESGSALLFVACGTISPPQKLPIEKKLQFLFDGLEKIIIAHRPNCLALEKIFYHRNPAVAMTLGQARAVPIILAGKYNLPLFEIGARQAKKNITGSGRADKNQMAGMVRVLLPTATPQTDHESDALGIAISALQNQEEAWRALSKDTLS